MTLAGDHIRSQILAIVHEQGCMLLEELPLRLPGSTWNQVFMSVDALSRQGAICLRRRGMDYEVLASSPSASRLFESRSCVISSETARPFPCHAALSA